MQNTFLFQPTASKFSRYYLIAIYTFAFCAIWFTFKGWCLLFMLMIFIAAAFYFFNSDTDYIIFEYAKEKEWILHINAESLRATFLPSSVLNRYFCVLYFEIINTHERKTVVLFADSLSKRDFRLLLRYTRYE